MDRTPPRGIATRWLRKCLPGCCRKEKAKLPSAVLYTRLDCHLCEIAQSMLENHGFEVSKIDIDQEPTLLAKYDDCVPVVEIDGKVRFRGRIDERLLRRLKKNSNRSAT